VSNGAQCDTIHTIFNQQTNPTLLPLITLASQLQNRSTFELHSSGILKILHFFYNK